MVELTLLEVHFEDSNLTANTGRPSSEKEVRAGEEPTEELPESSAEEPASRGGGALAAVIGLVFLVAVAYAVRETILDRDEPDEVLVGDDEKSEYTEAEA